MDILKKRKGNTTLGMLYALFLAFTAGIGTYDAIIRIAHLEVVHIENYLKISELSDKYVLRDEYENLKKIKNSLETDNGQYRQLLEKSPCFYAVRRNRSEHISHLDRLIQEGESVIQNELNYSRFESWRNQCVYLMLSIDEGLQRRYKDKLDSLTNFPSSNYYLIKSRVKESIILLQNLRRSLRE